MPPNAHRCTTLKPPRLFSCFLPKYNPIIIISRNYHSSRRGGVFLSRRLLLRAFELISVIFSRPAADLEWHLVVHGAETCRTDGYGVLRTAQEAEPGVIPARLSSHDYGCVHLGLSQIFAR